MFNYIVISILVLLLAYVVFYVVELLKVLINYLKVLLPMLCEICERLKQEQEAIDILLLNPSRIFHSMEGVTRTVEEIVSVGKQLKRLWKKDPPLPEASDEASD